MVARATPETFWAKVQGADNECWLWPGTRFRDGYGQAKYHGRKWRAHRLAWWLTYGHEPTAQVLHNCPQGDNPLCVNPQHLWLGSPVENSADMVAKGRQARGERHGWQRHPESLQARRDWRLYRPESILRGEHNAAAKLAPEHVRAIRQQHQAGTSYNSLAQIYGITKSQVARIVQRQSWRHVE
jgi:predicted DNA-binding protein (UPF0251 family)